MFPWRLSPNQVKWVDGPRRIRLWAGSCGVAVLTAWCLAALPLPGRQDMRVQFRVGSKRQPEPDGQS